MNVEWKENEEIPICNKTYKGKKEYYNIVRKLTNIMVRSGLVPVTEYNKLHPITMKQW